MTTQEERYNKINEKLGSSQDDSFNPYAIDEDDEAMLTETNDLIDFKEWTRTF